MTEEELIQLVKQIRRASGCMVDLDGLLGKFEASVNNPAASEWIFVPGSAGRLLDAEEVVAKGEPKAKAEG